MRLGSGGALKLAHPFACAALNRVKGARRMTRTRDEPVSRALITPVSRPHVVAVALPEPADGCDCRSQDRRTHHEWGLPAFHKRHRLANSLTLDRRWACPLST